MFNIHNRIICRIPKYYNIAHNLFLYNIISASYSAHHSYIWPYGCVYLYHIIVVFFFWMTDSHRCTRVRLGKISIQKYEICIIIADDRCEQMTTTTTKKKKPQLGVVRRVCRYAALYNIICAAVSRSSKRDRGAACELVKLALPFGKRYICHVPLSHDGRTRYILL